MLEAKPISSPIKPVLQNVKSSVSVPMLNTLENYTKELEILRLYFPLLGSHIYISFAYIKYNVWEGREKKLKWYTYEPSAAQSTQHLHNKFYLRLLFNLTLPSRILLVHRQVYYLIRQTQCRFPWLASFLEKKWQSISIYLILSWNTRLEAIWRATWLSQ